MVNIYVLLLTVRIILILQVPLMVHRMKKNPRLKIVQVNQMESSGGAAKISLNLHRQISERGHVSWMVVGEKTSADPFIFQITEKVDIFGSSLFKALSIHTAEMKIPMAKKTLGHYLNKLGTPRHLIAEELGFEDYYYPASRNILDLLPDAPDIVHLHNLHEKYFDLNFLTELSHKVPTMITLHDAWLLSGHCAHSLDCEKWKTGCGQCPYLEVYPAVKRDATHFNWKLKKKIFSHSGLYIATPSRWLLEKVEQSILEPAMLEGRVIHNGVDQFIFNSKDRRGVRSRLGISDEVVTLLFVANQGTKNAYKDFDTISKAIELIKNSELDKEILMLVVGGGKGIADHVESDIGNIHIYSIPYLDDPVSVADCYRAADIYLQASLADTFPSVILEALSCGTPVVATSVGGIPEQVIDGQTGYLVKTGDWKAMAELTIKLIKDDQLRIKMGRLAEEDAQKRFQIGQMVNNYIDWYYEILEGIPLRGKP